MNDVMCDLTQQVKEHKKRIEKMTLNTAEFAQVMGITPNKARQLMRSKDFPAITVGCRRLVVIAHLNEWLSQNIGQVF